MLHHFGQYNPIFFVVLLRIFLYFKFYQFDQFEYFTFFFDNCVISTDQGFASSLKDIRELLKLFLYTYSCFYDLLVIKCYDPGYSFGRIIAYSLIV